MKLRCESIEFLEEVDDYRFGEAFPFNPYEQSILVTLDEPVTLQFDYMMTTPKLDGATAFYPVCSAFVQVAYSGFRDYYNLNPGGYHARVWFLDAAQDGGPYEHNILSCTKTGAAYRLLADKKVDMIFAFEPSAEQEAAATAKGEEFVLTSIGHDAFYFFVNTKNPINSLTVAQVQDIIRKTGYVTL
ncbi:MAG: substrate-binding domain-containing protein [Firmicutes bacterium]|nr:substrate-binding domain-containing protein [Bacillota bacterium]